MRPVGSGVAGGAVRAGLVASGAWLVLVLGFWLFGPEGAPRSGLARLGTLVGIIMPLVLIWAAVGMAQVLAGLRAEAAALRAQLHAMRAQSGEGVAGDPVPPASPRPMPTPAAALAAPAAAAAAAATSRPAPARAGATTDARQPRLDLDAVEAPAPVSPADLVLGLNFPDGPDDVPAITALHNALRDPDLARMIRAAQDVITLLADRGIYMDDLAPDLPRPELWRRFAEGMRGQHVEGLAGLRDAELEGAIATLLRGDEILRDTSHHFLRQYDRMLARHAARLSDDELLALSDTRSGRAFMLLAQVAGVFG